jgi:hypothetical protein
MTTRRTHPGRTLAFVLGLALATSDHAQGQTAWSPFGTRNATDVAVGVNGVVWIIGNDPAGAADKNIYRWDGNAFQQMVGQAVRIAVDPNGKAWVVNSSGSIFRWIETSWQDMPGKAIDIGIGARGEVWVLDVNGSPFKWDGNNWRQIGGGGWRIAVDPSGNPWVVNQGNQIWRWKGTSWDLLPGSAKDIAVGPDGTVLIISTTPAPGGFQVQRWADGRWIPEADAEGAGVAAGPAGALYVMRDTGAMVRRSGGPAVAGTTAAAQIDTNFAYRLTNDYAGPGKSVTVKR